MDGSQSLPQNVAFYDVGAQASFIWFGGLHEAFPRPDFLRRISMNGMFFRDVGENWYRGGIEGLTRGDEETIEFLQRQFGSNCVLAGQSSGGYAALRYAHAIEPLLCIAMAPQTANRDTGPSTLLLDVEGLFRDHPKGFPVSLHLSRSEAESRTNHFWDDWRQIEQLKAADNVTVTRHPYDHHAVSLGLHRDNRFYATLEADVLRFTGDHRR